MDVRAVHATSPSELSVVKSSSSLSIQANQVEVSVICAAFGESDVRMVGGELLFVSFPFVAGQSFCGVVKKVGGAVDHVKHGDKVMGFCKGGALADVVVVDGAFVSRVSETTDAAMAAALVEPALRAFMAFHYQFRGLRGETVLIMDAARGPCGEVAMQIAMHFGFKVVAACSVTSEATVLESRFPGVRVVVVEHAETDLADAVMRATEGLGVDCVYESLQVELSSPLRRARINSLAAHGVWCVHREMQLDPPDSKALLLRAAKLAFVFPQAWFLSPLLKGRFMHILAEISKSHFTVSTIDRFPLAKVTAAREAVARADGAVAVMMTSK
jgi:NADPH:quinone reductase-like Zn-dependent oxidoreductase